MPQLPIGIRVQFDEFLLKRNNFQEPRKDFMKIFLLMLLFSTSIFATQTRLLALGMKELDNDGSFYIKDDRNIFINPAHVNDYGDFALFDVGGEGQQIGVNQTTISTDQAPKALGGFLLRSGKVVWGGYLGNESNIASTLRILGSSGLAAFNGTGTAPKLLPTAQDQIDLFIGWGEKLHWGGNVYFYDPGKNETEGTTSNSGYGLRLGVKDPDRKSDLNVTVSLGNKVVNNYTSTSPFGSINGTQTFDGNLGLFIGGSYQFKPLRLIAWLKTFSWEQTDTGTYPPSPPWVYGGQNGTVKGDLSLYNLGIANEIDFNPSVKFFWELYVRQTDVEVKFKNVASAQSLAIPLVFAVEAYATDWLQFRGSIFQNVYGVSKNKNYSSLNVVARRFATDLFGPDNGGNSSSLPASTEIQLGSSLIFGGLKIDGLLGVSDNPLEAPSTLVDFSNFFVRAAVTYRF
jgi:hypothetical protein